MREYRTEYREIEFQTEKNIICDRCGKTKYNEEGAIENSMHSFDGEKVEFDLCHFCLEDLEKDFLIRKR